MAVAHDAQSESHTGSTGHSGSTSFNWNHTPTGTPRAALVFIEAIGTNPVMGVTYNSVAMSAVPYTAADTGGEVGTVQAWFLDNVASGTQNIVVTRTSKGSVVCYATCITVTASSACEVYSNGVKTIAGDGTEQTAASSSNANNSSNWSAMALDDGSPGTNSQRYMACHFGTSGTPAAGANTTIGLGIDFGLYVFSTYRETTPSQGSKTLNIGTANSDDLAVVGLAIRETPPPPPAPPPRVERVMRQLLAH